MSARFRFTLQEQGVWAVCRVELDAEGVEWRAASLSGDVLGELMLALEQVLLTRLGAEVEFIEAPKSTRLSLLAEGDDGLRIQLRAFKDWFKSRRVPGELLFDRTARLRTFAGSVLAEVQAMAGTDTARLYAARWASFPAEALGRLQTALKVTKHGA